MEQAGNVSGFMRVYGFIFLPKKYQLERDIVMNVVGVMAFISIMANAVLLLAIIRDPFKQLRTITAILLAFNSAANLGVSLVLLLDSAFCWNDEQLSPQLVAYLSACTASLYFIGNLLHTVNIYATIVVPVRYSYLAPKARKILVPFLFGTSVVLICVTIIPPYTLPDSKRQQSYLKGILTFVSVQLTLLTLTFICLYTKIFQALHARRQRLVKSFQIKRSTPQGLKIMKRNSDVAKTLFIHVLFFVIVASPSSVVLMIYLHCTTSREQITLHLAALFTIPFVYTSFVFHPFLWLSRLNSYRQAMKQTLSFRKRSKTHSTSHTNNNGTNNQNSSSSIDVKSRTDTMSTVATSC